MPALFKKIALSSNVKPQLTLHFIIKKYASPQSIKISHGESEKHMWIKASSADWG